MDKTYITKHLEKLDHISDKKNIDCFLITSIPNIKYFSGFFYDFTTGPSPFHLLPAALLKIPSETSYLLVADDQADDLDLEGSDLFVEPYTSYVYKEPVNENRKFLTQLKKIIKKIGFKRGRIGIESTSIPFVIEQFLKSEFSKLEFVDIESEINHARIIKDEEEIKFIRRAAKLCDIGQEALLEFAQTGISEISLFNLVRSEIESSVGTRVPLMADFISGKHTANAGGIPTDKIIGQGDLILCDLTPCLNGYWGDSCNTIVVGNPTSKQKEIFKLVKEALEIGINAICPGVEAREIDRLMRDHIGDYPHHGGHGVGTVYHEEPRIVSYNDMKLKKNMVIALEPAIYENDFGIRLEHLIKVTENGSETITNFSHRIN